MEEMVRNRMLDELAVPPAAAAGAGAGGGGPGAGSGSLASASASNLLDVAETASEAWSMDVLASDSESLRLGELDNEDTASVARWAFLSLLHLNTVHGDPGGCAPWLG